MGKVIKALFVVPLALTTVVAAGSQAQAVEVALPWVVDGSADAPTSAEAAAALEVPSSEVVLAKTLAETQVSADLTLILAEGALQPVPDEANAPVADPDGGSGGSTYQPALKLAVVGAYQNTSYRCVPASGETILKTMGVSVTQNTLAQEMYTNSSGGTYMGNAVRPLNRRQSRNEYMFNTDTTSGKQLLSRTIVDVKNARVALMIGVQMAQASWYPSGRYVGRHAVAPYGYYTQSGGGLYLWDPWNETYFGGSTNYGGKKTVNINNAWSANAANSAKIVW